MTEPRDDMELEAVKEILNYNPETGEFVWAKSRVGCRKGDQAGGPKPNGYIRIGLGRKRYAGHRLAWLLTYGSWPNGDIDHINHNHGDNRIANLRVVTQQENSKNMPLRKGSSTGIVGVNRVRGKQEWSARIKVMYETKYLGNYDNFFDACCARKAAEVEYNFHPNHGKQALDTFNGESS